MAKRLLASSAQSLVSVRWNEHVPVAYGGGGGGATEDRGGDGAVEVGGGGAAVVEVGPSSVSS